MAQYADFAEYYDLDHALTFDIDLYLDYARACGSPVLELGCGTGRLLVPLAEAGFEVYGVDISANMLDVCRRKVADQGLGDHVHLLQADMAHFTLPGQDFALVFIALRSFMHLLTQQDQLACLSTVYRHLRPGGCFIVAIMAPDCEKLAQKPEETFTVRREFDLPGSQGPGRAEGHHVVRYNRLVAHDKVQQVRYFELCFE